MYCLFCNCPEPSYEPDEGVDIICSRCVIQLNKYSQEELKRGHALALEKGYNNKATALTSFIRRDNNVKQRKPKSNIRRLPAGKGSNGISRSKQTTNQSTTVHRRITVRKGKSKSKTLFRSRSPKLVTKT